MEKKKSCIKRMLIVIIFVFLMPVFSFAELGGNIEDFKRSEFFRNYQFSDISLVYSVDESGYATFRGKGILKKITLELDSKNQKIVRYIVYMDRPIIPENTFEINKDERNAFILELINEATGRTIDRDELTSLLKDFDLSFMSAWSGESPAANPFFGDIAVKEGKIGGHYFKISGTLWGEIIEIQDAARRAAKKKEYKEFVEKLEKGDAESYVLKGKLAERERDTNPTMKAHIRSFEKAIPYYQKAIELDSEYFDAYLLLARAYKELGEVEKLKNVCDKAVKKFPEKTAMFEEILKDMISPVPK